MYPHSLMWLKQNAWQTVKWMVLWTVLVCSLLLFLLLFPLLNCLMETVCLFLFVCSFVCKPGEIYHNHTLLFALSASVLLGEWLRLFGYLPVSSYLNCKIMIFSGVFFRNDIIIENIQMIDKGEYPLLSVLFHSNSGSRFRKTKTERMNGIDKTIKFSSKLKLKW